MWICVVKSSCGYVWYNHHVYMCGAIIMWICVVQSSCVYVWCNHHVDTCGAMMTSKKLPYLMRHQAAGDLA